MSVLTLEMAGGLVNPELRVDGLQQWAWLCSAGTCICSVAVLSLRMPLPLPCNHQLGQPRLCFLVSFVLEGSCHVVTWKSQLLTPWAEGEGRAGNGGKSLSTHPLPKYQPCCCPLSPGVCPSLGYSHRFVIAPSSVSSMGHARWACWVWQEKIRTSFYIYLLTKKIKQLSFINVYLIWQL